MKTILYCILLFACYTLNAQDVNDIKYGNEYIEYLYEKGINKQEGILQINDDSKKAITDENYRKLLYPKTYTWDKVNTLIQKNYLKQAFWHLINIYDLNEESKKLAVRIVLAYNNIFDMKQALIGTFYSYAYSDNEIGNVKNGKITIDYPNVLEDKLQNVTELVTYLEKN